MANGYTKEKLVELWQQFGEGKLMVLSTSKNDYVSSRMMSVVQMGGRLYFQTDNTMRKYRQLSANPNVALCTDNLQIEGVCKEIGHPLENAGFCESFKRQFESSFNAYTSLENERLFEVMPTYIQRWVYKDGLPFIEAIDTENESYSFKAYCGE